MPAFPTHPGLEAAVIADDEDDLPRLVYADWLEEHDDPDRAEFIRVQCRLGELSPAEAEWVDLNERQAELNARLVSRLFDLAAKLPKVLDSCGFAGDDDHEFRRGFDYFARSTWGPTACPPRMVASLIAALPRLVETTTVRGLSLSSITANGLADLFAAPSFARFTGLSLSPFYTSAQTREQEFAAVWQTIATSPHLGGLRYLVLRERIGPAGVAALARPKSLDGVRRLTIEELDAPAADLVRLTKAPWFRRLQRLRIHLRDPQTAGTVIEGLGRLPDLHTLELPDLDPGAVPALAAGKFSRLGRLVLGCPIDQATAQALAAGKFPRLAVLQARHCSMKDDALITLTEARWFPRLRVLDLTANHIGDPGVAALAGGPVAKALRILRLTYNPLGKGAFKALARPGAFGQLTTLELYSNDQRKGPQPDLAAFLAALDMPRLRHLDLGTWPVGVAGALVLAASPAFANLTRLSLVICGIGDEGARALLASPHLQGLVELQLGYNAIEKGVDALADPKVLPRLGACSLLAGNNVPKASATKIKRARRNVIV